MRILIPMFILVSVLSTTAMARGAKRLGEGCTAYSSAVLDCENEGAIWGIAGFQGGQAPGAFIGFTAGFASCMRGYGFQNLWDMGTQCGGELAAALNANTPPLTCKGNYSTSDIRQCCNRKAQYAQRPYLTYQEISAACYADGIDWLYCIGEYQKYDDEGNETGNCWESHREEQ